jgi:glycosyltransferase involved in cell wall biosynthesis
MNLLYLTHQRRFKTFARATAFARQMVKRGHRVTLVCIADTERWRLREYEEEGIHYVETPDLLPGKLRSGWDLWDTLRRRLYLRGKTFDLVHAFEARPATIYPALAFLRRQPAPLVMDWIDWWGRGGLIRELRPRWYQILFEGLETYYEEHFRTRAQATTVISHALAERAVLLGVPRSSITWVPGGVDVNLFRPLPREPARAALGLPADALVLGYSALDVTNDADFVFAAMREIARQRPEALLLMAGRQSPALEALVDRCGIRSCFRHAGLVPHARLPEVLAAVDIFLLPFTSRISNIGRWPNKIGDYMAMGRPTVTNPVGEMKLLLEREPVGLLAGEDPRDFAAQTLRLIEDPALRNRLGRRAREVAESELRWERVCDQVESCYRATLDRFSRP